MPRLRWRSNRGLAFALILAAGACTDNTSPSSQTPPPIVTPMGVVGSPLPQVVVAAGDIATCSNNNDEATAALVDNIAGTVLVLGDNAYASGTTSEYTNCYDPTWGRHKARTRPVPGNHEYDTPGASGYFTYFGPAAGEAGKGYYSFDLGAWHIIALNSEISKSPTSAQMRWLRTDLAAHPNFCTLAYWHKPLYSSTGLAGSGGTTDANFRPLWDTLYAYGADLILNGHRHNYERIAPIRPDGTRDAQFGIRAIIAGSGGIGGATITNVFPASEVREGRTFGVLKLHLYDDSYAWRFVPVAGETFTDSSSTTCHGAPGSGGSGSEVSASQSTVSAAPTTITASDGSSTSTITVTVKDATGQPMSGVTVTLSATGSGNTLTQPAGPSNASGVATGRLASTDAEAKTVSASAGATAITQTATVTVVPPAAGGISHTLLAAGNDVANQRTYATASVAPAPNALVTVAVVGHNSTSAPASPTLSGGGLSAWTEVASVTFDSLSVPHKRMTIFRALGTAPASGPITITFPAAVSNCQWIVSQWSGVELSGTNGSGAVVQTGSNRGDGVSTLTAALAPFGSSGNVAYGVVGVNGTGLVVSPGSGFAEIAEQSSGESPRSVLEAEWATGDNSVQATWSGLLKAGILGVELRAAGP